MGFDVADQRTFGARTGHQRPELVDDVVGHPVSRHIQLASAEPLAIVIADVGTQPDPRAHSRGAGHAHHVRVAGVKAAGNAGARHQPSSARRRRG